MCVLAPCAWVGVVGASTWPSSVRFLALPFSGRWRSVGDSLGAVECGNKWYQFTPRRIRDAQLPQEVKARYATRSAAADVLLAAFLQPSNRMENPACPPVLGSWRMAPFLKIFCG